MATAPIVEYYRLVDDGTNSNSFQYVNPAAPAPETLLDFGTVDAGTNTYQTAYDGDNSILTDTNKAVQVYAIYNNNSNSTSYNSSGVSDMQDTYLSIVSNETGQQGNSAGDVYEHRWVNVLLNNGTYGTDDVALGKYTVDTSPTAVADTTETKLQLTAMGLDATVSTNVGVIKGKANGGSLTGTDTENFAQIKTWVDIKPNAPAGPHLFRLRTTYSYT